MKIQSSFLSSSGENHQLSGEQVAERIYWQLLFNPAGIALPDSYVFSTTLADKPAEIALTAALEVQKLDILVRNPHIRNFSDLRSDLQLLNLGAAEREAMDGLAQNLNPFSGGASWRSWPSGAQMGQTYRSLVQQYLLLPERELTDRLHHVVEAQPLLSNLAPFQDAIREAADFSDNLYSSGVPGRFEFDLRQNEIIISLTRSIFGTSVNNYPDAIRLSRAVSSESFCFGVSAFFELLGTLYELNWGRRAGLSVERVKRSKWIDKLLNHSVDSNGETNEESLLIKTVKMPSRGIITSLTTRKLERIIELRSNYELAYKQFLNPVEGAKKDELFEYFAIEIDAYSRRIIEIAGGPQDFVDHLIWSARTAYDDIRQNPRYLYHVGSTAIRDVLISLAKGDTLESVLITDGIGAGVQVVLEILPLSQTNVSVGFSIDGRVNIGDI